MVPEFNVSQNTAMSLSFCSLKILLLTKVVSIWHMEVMFVLYLSGHCEFVFFNVALDNNKSKTQSAKVQGEYRQVIAPVL